MENQETNKRALNPSNQKSVYASFALVYEKLMADEISVEKAEQASNALSGMNRAVLLEIKRAEVERLPKIRNIETKNFEEEK